MPLNRGWWFMIVFLMTLQCPGKAFSQSYPYKFNYITVDEGLSHTDANDIVQDKSGLIWVATFFGLSRFDGYTVKRYYNNNTPLNNAFKNRVRSVCADDKGDIWLSTEDGLQRFDVRTEKYIDLRIPGEKNGQSFEQMLKTPGDLLYGILGGRLKILQVKGDSVREKEITNPAVGSFSNIAVDGNDGFYVAGEKGLWHLDNAFRLNKVAVGGLKEDCGFSLVSIDGKGRLIVTGGNSLYLLNKMAGKDKWEVISKFVAPGNCYVKGIAKSDAGEYWANTGTDLFRLDSQLKLVQVVNTQSSPHSLNSSSLAKMMIDRSGCLWVCTFGGGVNYCDLHQKQFYTLQHDAGTPGSLSGNHIRSLLQYGDSLWVGTMANGLNLYNRRTGAYTFYNSYNAGVKLKNDMVTALALDDDKNLWIGSGAGIEVLRPNRKQLWKPPGAEAFPTYVIETLAKDCFGNIWFGNHVNRYGVIWKDRQQVFHVRYYDEGYFILPDKHKPQLFVSSTHGLKQVIIDSEGNILRTFCYTAGPDGNSLSSNYTYPVRMQNDSTWWIGTIGGGLNRLTLHAGSDAYTIKRYGTQDGIFHDVESLEIDNEGKVWMGGNGLECLDPVTGKLTKYDKHDGLQGNAFKVGSSYKGEDGTLFFGGINGLNYFIPARIKANNLQAHPQLTDITINNTSRPASYCKSLQLGYQQNNLVISFSSMHFANPLKCKYRYKLVGLDRDWKFTDGKSPAAVYNNLDFASYDFIVEATNNDGTWSPYQATISITIIPPWYKSPVAKTMYIILVLLALSAVYFYQARWLRLKKELEVRSINEKLYQQQLTFFTNISHEFRTPLTLILGPLESLISQNNNAALDNSYKLMQRNVKRLINLVSELMNFKKVADSVIRLQVRPVAIDQFCRDMALEFKELANGKKINFTVTNHTGKGNPDAETGYFDVQVLEKILFNLLSNSFKYTNAGGQVSFDIMDDMAGFKPSFSNGLQLLSEGYRAKKYIYFRIADSGIGISGDSLKNIFDRYYRISKNHLGSGVGLALVKSLTQLHKGDIYVYSDRYKGTEIIIGLPRLEDSYTRSERATIGSVVETQLETIDNTTLAPLAAVQGSHHVDAGLQKQVLIVDDNEELRIFLRQSLETKYKVYEAKDGQEALDLASEKVPDLVISDVRMPGMSGIELCRLMKDKFETSHIPFIMLSARDALDVRIEGMESGADYYFAKPLSIDLLLLTVQNLFRQQKRQRERYTNDHLSEVTELVSSEKDKAFLHLLLDLVSEHMQEADLDADFLCERLFISRTKLYQKIKSISGQSVAEFIRTIRLKKAIHIMTHEDIAMHDVAERIGMQSASNFSRAFRKEYSQSPLQFMQSLKKL